MALTVFQIFWVKQEGQKFIHDEAVLSKLGNTLDRWILSFTQSLVLFVHKEMAGKSEWTAVSASDRVYLMPI